MHCLIASLPVHKQATSMMAKDVEPILTPRKLSLQGRSLPPALPLVISSQDRWNPDSCKLEANKGIQDQDRILVVVEDALCLLCSIDKPLAILSICGPYRSGKSYFMSRLLGTPGAFKLGHTM